MRFDTMLAARQQARMPRDPVEFPKYVAVDGKPVLVLNQEHETELLGASDSGSDTDDSEPSADSATVNLLSAPEKRKPGRPRIIHPDRD